MTEPANASSLSVIKEEGEQESSNDREHPQVAMTSTITDSGQTMRGSEESVKFDISMPDMHMRLSDTSFRASSSNYVTPSAQTNRDETLQLFDCMPKGFETFMETGPCRRVFDYLDLDKLYSLQGKKDSSSTEKEEPRELRFKAIATKDMELESYMKKYDPFIMECTKKLNRANLVRKQLRITNRDLTEQIATGENHLQALKNVRDKLVKDIARYEVVNSFIEKITSPTNSQYPNFVALMHRNITLQSTNKYLSKKFANRHQQEQEMGEELQATRDFAKRHMIMLRQELVVLKKSLSHLTAENHYLEQKCNKWKEMASDKTLDVFNMTMCINNITKGIMNARPFWEGIMANTTDVFDKMDKLGLFINDCTDIIHELDHTFVKRMHKVSSGDTNMRLPNKKQTSRSGPSDVPSRLNDILIL